MREIRTYGLNEGLLARALRTAGWGLLHRQAHDAGYAVFSNLLVQLYGKQRLVEALIGNEDIDDGVEFRIRYFGRRKIGANQVVLSAVRRIRDYVNDVIYVALIPNAADFEAVVREFGTINAIQCSAWRAFPWSQIEEYCRSAGLLHTLRAFEFNKGQIY
jgi:hypothetical protein